MKEMDQEQFNILMEKWRSQQVTQEEFLLFKAAAQDAQSAKWMAEMVFNELEVGRFESLVTEEQRADAYNRFINVVRTDKRIHFLRAAWFRYAAILLLLAGTATFLYVSNKSQKQQTVQIQPDIPPGGNRATLTLANGSVIILDTAANGALAQQGNTSILKSAEGSLTYNAGESKGEVLYNSISTPKGGQYQITLPDGTRAWLNAASSIRFPAFFKGSGRKVFVTGEVYFEIEPDKAKPFYVNVSGMEIQVLGTSFNINAYTEEDAISTTLIEGSVRINAHKQTQALKPRQQLEVTANGEFKINNTPDIDKVMAWKNGLFNFQDKKLPEVMRQLSRWYNIEVIYQKGIPDIEFGGKMSRNVKLADVLVGLKGAGVKFSVEEGRKLIVLPDDTE